MVTTRQRPAAERPQLPRRDPRLELLRRQRRPDGLLRPRHRAGRDWPRPRPTTASGMAGASPRSLLMAVKVGDTYVVHSENLAQGVVYAADHGADVINTSLGATGNSKLLRAAATYAYSKGVFWAAATANEYSTHHNYPTNLDTVAGAGGLGPELADPTVQTCQSVGSAGRHQLRPGQPADHLPPEGQLRQLRRHPDVRHADRHGRDEPRRHGLRPPPVGHLDRHAAPRRRGRDRAQRRLPRRPVRRARRHRRRARRDRLQPADGPGGAQLQRGPPAARLHGHARPQRRRRRRRRTTTRPTRAATRRRRAASTTRSRAATRTAAGTSGPASAAPTSTPPPPTPSRG